MIAVRKTPTYWSAAHSPVVFEFNFETHSITACNDNGEGKLLVVPSAIFGGPVTNGGFIYIDTGIYKGYHKVIGNLFNLAFSTDTDFIGTQTTGNISVITSETFRIYKGFESGELYDYDNVLPLELVAEFTPEPNLDGKLRFDISGYLQSFFNPNNYPDLHTLPIGTKQYFIGLFNRYRLVQLVADPDPEEENLIFTGMVAQSGAEQSELNELYYPTPAELAQEIPPLIYQNCNTDLSALNTFGLYLKRYTNGVLSTDNIIFSNQFGSAFKH